MTTHCQRLWLAAAAMVAVVRADVCCVITASGGVCIDDATNATLCQSVYGGYHRVTNATCALNDALGLCTTCLPCTAAGSGSIACTAGGGECTPHSMSCASRYGRCFVPAVRRRRTAEDATATAVYVCGGASRVDLPCAVDIDATTCAVGRCVFDAEYGALGQTLCADLRRFPCACSCNSATASACARLDATAFQDINGNGAPDTGEPRAVNATIGLWRGVFAASSPPLRTTSTNAAGQFSFVALDPDTYFASIVALSATDAATYVPVSNNVASYTLVCATSSSSAAAATSVVAVVTPRNLFITTPKYVYGRVLFDANANNADDGVGAGEYGIAGATVRALLRPALSVEGQTTTATDGSFLFTALPTGVYDFEELDAPGFNVSTGDSQPPNDNRIAEIVVTSTENVTSLRFYDAPFNGTAPTPAPSAGDDDDDSEFPHRRRECESALTWWWYADCFDYTLENHVTSAVFSMLLLFVVCVCCCLASFLFCGSANYIAPKIIEYAMEGEEEKKRSEKSSSSSSSSDSSESSSSSSESSESSTPSAKIRREEAKALLGERAARELTHRNVKVELL